MRYAAVLAVLLSCFVSAACSGQRAATPSSLAPTLAVAQALPEWEISVADNSAPTLSRSGAPVVTAEYVSWGAEWAWSDTSIRRNPERPNERAHLGEAPGLGTAIAVEVTQTAPNVLAYTYAFDVREPLTDVIGVCMEWHPTLAQGDADPELLPENRGWTWQVGGQPVEVAFAPPAADVYFEVGDRGRIRTFLLRGDVPAGEHSISMTLTLPQGVAFVQSAAERYGPENLSEWHPGLLALDASPVDLSYLNDETAGEHGFLTAQGDQLVFEDGAPARFWGGNLAAYALFVSDAEIETQARRIAALGYNLMRIHHHDSMGWVEPTVIDKSRDDSRRLDARAMDRIDYWVKCLRDEGVYVWLDLHVGRMLKPGDVSTELGTIGGVDEIARENSEVKGFCYYDMTIQALMQEFNAQYLNHVNPYTGLAYKDDPAIMGLLITNENDLTTHFGNMMLGDKGNPYYNGLFEQDVTDYCNATGLPREQTWRTWEPGPSKAYLNHKEHLFNGEMLAHLEGLGARVPVATTQTWGCGLWSLPALTDGGLIDVHSYGEAEALSANPRSQANFISWLAAGQVSGMPMSVTEWNVPYPATDRFTAPLYVASVASLQGWDAPMIYNYCQGGFAGDSHADTWSTYSDPALTAVTPAAALAFREGHIAPAREEYCLTLTGDQLLGGNLSPATSAAVRTLAERSKLTIGMPELDYLPWLEPRGAAPGATAVTDPERDFIPEGQTYVESDTGELRRDWRAGVQTIDTPKTQAASGWIGGSEIALTDLTCAIETPKCVIAATALDGQPIAASERILITLVARVSAPDGQLPYRSEPVVGTLRLHAQAGLRLVPLGPDGTEGAALPTTYADGVYEIALTGAEGAHWLVLGR